MRYFSMEVCDRRYVATEAQQVTAEWTYTPDEFGPIAEAEMERVDAILSRSLAEPAAINRRVPDDDGRWWTVQTPKPGSSSPTVRLDRDGNIVDSSTTWQCGYCRYRDRCIADG